MLNFALPVPSHTNGILGGCVVLGLYEQIGHRIHRDIGLHRPTMYMYWKRQQKSWMVCENVKAYIFFSSPATVANHIAFPKEFVLFCHIN